MGHGGLGRSIPMGHGGLGRSIPKGYFSLMLDKVWGLSGSFGRSFAGLDCESGNRRQRGQGPVSESVSESGSGPVQVPCGAVRHIDGLRAAAPPTSCRRACAFARAFGHAPGAAARKVSMWSEGKLWRNEKQFQFWLPARRLNCAFRLYVLNSLASPVLLCLHIHNPRIRCLFCHACAQPPPSLCFSVFIYTILALAAENGRGTERGAPAPPPAHTRTAALELAELLARVDRGGAELLLDAHELVVLGRPLRAARRARLDLRRRRHGGAISRVGAGREGSGGGALAHGEDLSKLGGGGRNPLAARSSAARRV